MVNQPNYGGFGYTGHVQDAVTGLTYMQQRYYDSMTGRTLSRDPVTAYSYGDMRFFNAYAYAFNNPYRFNNPDGRQSSEKYHEDYVPPPPPPEPPPEPKTLGTVTVVGSRQSAGKSQGNSGNPVASYLGGVIDSTTFVANGTVAGGIGATLEYSNKLKTGEQSLDLNGALGVGGGRVCWARD